MYLIISVVLLGFAIILQYSDYIIESRRMKFLVFGILSDRANIDKRQSIRDTWLNMVNKNNMSFYFILGNESCRIPPEDRLDETGCEEWIPPDINNIKESDMIQTSYVDQQSDLEAFSQYSGFVFRINYPVVLDKVSLSNEVLNHDGSAEILIRAADKEVFTTVNIPEQENLDKEAEDPASWTQKLKQRYLLPRGFEGYAELVQATKDAKCSYRWNLMNGVITFLHLLKQGTKWREPFTPASCVPFYLNFKLWDYPNLLTHVTGKKARQENWLKHLRELDEEIVSEVKRNKDIMIVDTPDIYRNLPKKVLTFLSWVNEVENFQYVLKTDDDMFINVDLVYKSLLYYDSLPRPKAPFKWMWSCFKVFWAVPAVGKWKDMSYISETYPPFPCGSGYVLSHDIVEYIGKNHKLLSTDFPGEDVAMGIWLAGLNPTMFAHFNDGLPKNNTHRCYWANDNSYCSIGHCNKPETSIEDMYNTWNHYKLCQNPCGCT